ARSLSAAAAGVPIGSARSDDALHGRRRNLSSATRNSSRYTSHSLHRFHSKRSPRSFDESRHCGISAKAARARRDCRSCPGRFRKFEIRPTWRGIAGWLIHCRLIYRVKGTARARAFERFYENRLFESVDVEIIAQIAARIGVLRKKSGALISRGGGRGDR